MFVFYCVIAFLSKYIKSIIINFSHILLKKLNRHIITSAFYECFMSVEMNVLVLYQYLNITSVAFISLQTRYKINKRISVCLQNIL